jgi:hypothetical protein
MRAARASCCKICWHLLRNRRARAPARASRPRPRAGPGPRCRRPDQTWRVRSPPRRSVTLARIGRMAQGRGRHTQTPRTFRMRDAQHPLGEAETEIARAPAPGERERGRHRDDDELAGRHRAARDAHRQATARLEPPDDHGRARRLYRSGTGGRQEPGGEGELPEPTDEADPTVPIPSTTSEAVMRRRGPQRSAISPASGPTAPNKRGDVAATPESAARDQPNSARCRTPPGARHHREGQRGRARSRRDAGGTESRRMPWPRRNDPYSTTSAATARLKAISSPRVSTVTTSPSLNSPSSSLSASGSWMSRWIVRLSGRAPNVGS